MLRLCSRCFGSIRNDVLLWHTDLKQHASGDFSVAVVQANSSLEDQTQVFTSPSATYIGVYDGHEASRLINTHLFGHLHIGSCCLVGAISDDVLYVANAGDCRAVLGKKGSGGRRSKPVVAERLLIDHNVGVEEVRKEVEALHPDDSHVVVYVRGVSRSIGDMYLKKPEFNRDPLFQHFGSPIPLKRAVMMTAEPSIEIRKIKPQDLFLIFASDGLWEQLTDEAAVDIVFKNPEVTDLEDIIQLIALMPQSDIFSLNAQEEEEVPLHIGS
ncbi:hypothetical protein MKX01_006043 [Papaver californicum]|nr:hypothetical protein MKX01_006043 [Papaver californicum]